jgi:hypothetical protein
VDIFCVPKNFFIFSRRRRASVVKRLTAELCLTAKKSLHARRENRSCFFYHCALFVRCRSGFSPTLPSFVGQASDLTCHSCCANSAPTQFTEKIPSQLRIS